MILHDASSRLLCPPLVKNELGQPRIKRVLIANRGEISCRISRTCKALGILAVSVYAEEDVDSAHVVEADEAINLGPIQGAQGNVYQNVALLVKVATEVKADAVHPGYGYLSENGDFVAAAIAAGLIFIGPKPEAMSTLGDKRIAKSFLRKNAPKIQLIPGYDGDDQDVERLQAEATGIGYPVLIKASAGGGGKGMRVVPRQQDFEDELLRAQSEARRSFGSADCILEKYIEHGKHVEIQIIGDQHGHVISLFDRDCSVQRRHQKIIEESPSPWLPENMREEMSDAASMIARLINYEGAATVEFIVDMSSKSFYFLEVNARIQVEHPITEEVTGLDIVGLQLFVAAGGRLKDLNLQIQQQGHAIECRLCAENPEREFMPDAGRILRWQPMLHVQSKSIVRLETAVSTGSIFSSHFDSMIAKIIVWSERREDAIKDMIKVLEGSVCLGIKTNQTFLIACLTHETFQSGNYSTAFITRYMGDLKRSMYLDSKDLQDLAIIPSIFNREVVSEKKRAFPNIPRGFRTQTADLANRSAEMVRIGDEWILVWSAFQRDAATKSFAYNVSNQSRPPDQTADSCDPELNSAIIDGNRYDSLISQALRASRGISKTGRILSLDTKRVTAGASSWLLGDLKIDLGGKSLLAYLVTDEDFGGQNAATPQRIFCHIPSPFARLEFHRYSRLQAAESFRVAARSETNSDRIIRAPMPCTVLQIMKENGNDVEAGEVLLVVESMKMEMKIIAAARGKFQCQLQERQAVQEDTVLCSII